MFVGVLTLDLLIHDAHSLKDRRAVVNSLLDRVRSRWNVSASQLDTGDDWHFAQVGVAVISNDKATTHTVLNHIRDFAEADIRFDVSRCQVEII
ncbi:MAG TPA: DUF503 domain-containing protein [Abditibacteriaceae bacterium]|jgi:hypothetical protein